MDLVSTIRKTGSRGGVNFSWSDVSTSTHLDHYLGHSLKAPGRWARGRDLNWYANSEPLDAAATEVEREALERRDEIRQIKEAEDEAMARALGLAPGRRNTTGANAIQVAAGGHEVGAAEAVPAAPPAPAPARRGGDDDAGRGRRPRHGGDRDPTRQSRRRQRDRSRNRSSSRSRSRGRESDLRRRKSSPFPTRAPQPRSRSRNGSGERRRDRYQERCGRQWHSPSRKVGRAGSARRGSPEGEYGRTDSYRRRHNPSPETRALADNRIKREGRTSRELSPPRRETKDRERTR